MKVAGIRKEDLLYAVVHKDESFPHVHLMALPSIVEPDPKEPNKSTIRFSTAKYNNRITNYYDTLHTKVIKEMKELGVDASGLLNGATKGKGFSPADLSYAQREESVRRSIENQILSQRNQQLEERAEVAEIEALRVEGKKAIAEQELDVLQRKKIESQAFSKKELQGHKKELQRIQKKDGSPQITQYEYERLLQLAKTEKELEEERRELAEKKKNFSHEVKKEAEKLFPAELKKVREEKAYCDEWLSRAQEVEQQQSANAAKEIVLAEWEDVVVQRERTVDTEVEYRARQYAQELYRYKKVSLLEVIWELFAALINMIIDIISVFLPRDMQNKVLDLASGFRDDLEKVFDELEIEHKEQGE